MRSQQTVNASPRSCVAVWPAAWALGRVAGSRDEKDATSTHKPAPAQPDALLSIDFDRDIVATTDSHRCESVSVMIT